VVDLGYRLKWFVYFRIVVHVLIVSVGPIVAKPAMLLLMVLICKWLSMIQLTIYIIRT